jgi:hypothetical protein
MVDLPMRRLCDLLKTHGPSLLAQPQKCKDLLLKECPQFPIQVQVLIRALESDVAADLLNAPSTLPLGGSGGATRAKPHGGLQFSPGLGALGRGFLGAGTGTDLRRGLPLGADRVKAKADGQVRSLRLAISQCEAGMLFHFLILFSSDRHQIYTSAC